MSPIHATTVARHGPGGWVGVMLRGPSGAGKSDLALRLMATGWRLVSDDYSHVWASGGAVHATAPATIAGRIEARGLGIVEVPRLWVAPIALVVDCVTGMVERMPGTAWAEVAGIALPLLTLDTRPASAVETVRLAVERL